MTLFKEVPVKEPLTITSYRTRLTPEQIQHIDQTHIWHPYASFSQSTPVYAVESASGVYIKLYNGQTLLDGMSSWWSTIHGYNPAYITQAVCEQAQHLSHIMFGGLTHEPAAYLTQQLVKLTPQGLEKVFYSDSGSVAVDVAMKMAIQYWQAQGKPAKSRIIALEKGYHGDSIGAMSVCDPVTGMHHLFKDTIKQQLFCAQPRSPFNGRFDSGDLNDLETKLKTHHHELAALIIEPVVQGAGGMHFYHPQFITQAKALCEHYNVLLIADEIATGFGRTGKLFACEHAEITPDIMCLGKTLTGGTMTLAATLCTNAIADTICQASPGVFMHGPTYMGNPLACTAASANIDLLLKSPWQDNIARIEHALKRGLAACDSLDSVNNVRVLGAIGVVELHEPVDMPTLQPLFVEEGVWLRPFGKLVYMMPAYTITNTQLATLTQGVYNVLTRYAKQSGQHAATSPIPLDNASLDKHE